MPRSPRPRATAVMNGVLIPPPAPWAKRKVSGASGGPASRKRMPDNRRMQRAVAVVLLLLLVSPALPAAPARPAGTVAPRSIAHGNAMFLASLCSSGRKKITIKAMAIGTRFFLEEPVGVTVYAFDGNGGYQKENFFKGLTLDQAMKKYRK